MLTHLLTETTSGTLDMRHSVPVHFVRLSHVQLLFVFQHIVAQTTPRHQATAWRHQLATASVMLTAIRVLRFVETAAGVTIADAAAIAFVAATTAAVAVFTSDVCTSTSTGAGAGAGIQARVGSGSCCYCIAVGTRASGGFRAGTVAGTGHLGGIPRRHGMRTTTRSVADLDAEVSAVVQQASAVSSSNCPQFLCRGFGRRG